MNNRPTILAASLLAAATSLLAQDAPPQGRDTLFRVISVNGDCLAVRPTLDAGEAMAAKMYPLGTLLRLGAGAEVMFNYQSDYSFTFAGPGEALVAAGGDGALLQIVQTQGKIRTSFVKSIHYGDVVIEAPGFTSEPGPECNMTVDAVREGGGMIASTVTIDRGEARLHGPHFNLPVLKGCTLRIQSALDRSLTRITGVLGEFPAQVEHSEELPVEFTMKPGAIIKMTRGFAPVTGREGVSVLIINESGVGRASYSFIPGDASLQTTGTLRAPPPEETPVEPVDGAADGAADVEPDPALLAPLPGNDGNDGDDDFSFPY